ncbi:ATP-dependent RNA helicase [Gracilibacillus halophilus YIM-C55.5]|uniref:ATP-dependent RNA helicase n=1 Tax=Gracilibacillus halophilus YIM-C55.5 TaxID=1308866 RepID=N4WT16_9BACI|nr:DEAD/DEAH box helicase [Gracilibacillus halophilus]ENH97490.1 ATP-dependent RNA helicase [Gracilibacillus halophilus YIM-C55.5]
MTQPSFNRYDFPEWIDSVIKQLHFQQPTPIQEKVIPQAIEGKSIIGQSETGSGKTHAYLLPLCSQLDENIKQVQMIVTMPTRELAMQVFDEIKKMINYAGKQETIKAKLVIGGTDKKRMIEKLQETPQIIVATPGRLRDLVEEKVLDIYSTKAFVIDEADLMVELGLIEEIDQILLRTDPGLQTLLFSATIPEQLQPFLRKYFEQPTYVKIDDQFTPKTMEHRLIPLRHRTHGEVIGRISEVINPYLAIIFTNGKEHANQLHDVLIEKGLNVGLIHGGLNQRERKRVLKEIQDLRYQYIVATDLASRGIDIQGVSHVINAEMPKEEDFYVHRVGRTARAGLEGTAISLYTDDDTKLVDKLEKKGLQFDYYDIVKGEWKEIKPLHARQKRVNQETDVEKQAWKKVRKPKKVKPGYKKRMKKQKDQMKKQIKQNRGK